MRLPAYIRSSASLMRSSTVVVWGMACAVPTLTWPGHLARSIAAADNCLFRRLWRLEASGSMPMPMAIPMPGEKPGEKPAEPSPEKGPPEMPPEEKPAD